MPEELKYTASAVGFDKVEAAINGTTKALANTAIAANKVDSALSKSVKGTNQAAFALQNLGRIAQDAPFGIIGITNNINPLLESFQRLKVEAGSTGNALKSLASSFFGAGGLGLVVSLASSALTFFALATRGAKSGLDETSNSIEEAIEDYKRLQKTIKETGETLSERNISASGSVEGDIAKVNSLVGVIKNQTLSYEQRNNALLELQRINKNYFSDLSLEEGSLKTLTTKVNEYTNALIAQSVVKSFSEDIGKLSVEFSKQLNIFNKLNHELDKNNLVLQNRKKILSEITDIADKFKKSLEVEAAQGPVTKASEALKKQSDIVVGLAANLRELKESFGTAIQESLKFKPLNAEGVKTDKRTIDDVLTDLRQQIALLNKEEFLFNIDNTKERVNAFLTAIKELAIKFDLDPNGKLIQSLFAESKFAKLGFIVKDGFLKMGVAAAREFKSGADAAFFQDPVIVTFKMVPIETNTGILPGVHNAIQESLGALPNEADLDKSKMVGELLAMGITTGIQDGLKVNVSALRFPEMTALVKSAKAQLEQVKAAVTQQLIALGDAIGNALAGAIDGKSGKEILGSFFGSLLEALGAGIRQFGIQSLAVTKIILAIKKTLGTTLGLVGSLAAIALGTLITALGAKLRVPAFAAGGVTPGGTILVGERGPELINVPRGSVVTPNHQLGSVDGALSAIHVVVEGQISGQTIYLSGQRYIQSRDRNT